MPLATFSPDPAPNNQFNVQHEPKVNRIAFGDGYSQRIGDGINNDALKVTLNWSNISDSEKDAFETFFTDKGGITAFNYTLPGEGSARAWSAPKYGYTHVKGTSVFNYTAELQEEFDL